MGERWLIWYGGWLPIRGPRFGSQSGPSQFFIAPLCPPSTEWVARSLKTRRNDPGCPNELSGCLRFVQDTLLSEGGSILATDETLLSEGGSILAMDETLLSEGGSFLTVDETLLL
ncbi:hypothetical protein PoB_001762500 [Plakobranchus ocellatus]|uniref:Uncharacterized protein n=1 Tax=Plakobranchus ocellatus TaxID=259542 RepID=A0AAV3Z992_9GAST|nr:hypothetical protein PoB_001762500 [Plakobranchus ocellatus]